MKCIFIFIFVVKGVSYYTLCSCRNHRVSKTKSILRNCYKTQEITTSVALFFCPSVSKISFNYSAENCPGPTDLANKYVEIVNRREIVSQIFFKINLYIMIEEIGRIYSHFSFAIKIPFMYVLQIPGVIF